MSNYANLKSAIQSVIKTNGNNEITGQLLQTELLAMITTLGYGYQFMGVASPDTVPGTPDAKVFYIAYTPGTYTNFGGIAVTGLCVLKYATSWVKEDIPVSGGGGGTEFAVEPTDLTLQSGTPAKLKFADRLRESNITTGKNYIILRENATFAQQVTIANAIYEIRYDFALSADFQIPANCVLNFQGGSINGAYNLDLNNCQIIGTNGWIGESLIIAGKTQTPAMVDWFQGIDALKIERAISTFHVCHLAGRDYEITRPIEINTPFSLLGESLPENFGTLSRTQLIATSEITCILNILKGTTFISANIEYVAFTASAGNHGVVNGINLCTPNGPSRPFAIRGCSFKLLKYGIYVYLTEDGQSTDLFNLSIIGCNLSKNNWGIYATGRHSIGCLTVSDSVLEQNTNGALYAYDADTTIGFGSIEFRNNLLEGQPTPIYVRTDGSVILSGNYFETSNYDCAVRIHGASGTAAIPVRIFGNHHSSNGAGYFHYYLSGSDIFRLYDSGTPSYNIHLNGCYVHQDGFNYRTKIVDCTRVVVFGNDGNSDIPTLELPIVPNFIEDGKPSLNAVPAGSNLFNLTRVVPVGKYRLVLFASVASASDAIYFRDGLNNISFDFTLPFQYRNRVLKIVHDVEISTQISGTNNTRYGCRNDGDAQAMKISGFCLFRNDNISIPKMKLADIITQNFYLNNIINPKEGVAFIYPRYNEVVGYKNGIGWVGSDGYTPAPKFGPTANRPTDILTYRDNGFLYYDTDLNMYVKDDVSYPVLLNYRLAAASTEHYSANTFTQGKTYRFRANRFNTIDQVSIMFTKTNDSTADAIVVPLTKTGGSATTSTSESYFEAPDPAIYPYIRFAKTYSSFVDFYVDDIVISWLSMDGFSSTNHRGTTANRPSLNSGDSGFTYFDTDFGKMIVWNGTAWVNMDGSALSQ